MTTFEQLGLSKEIIKALRENGFESPFPIQQEAIPPILKGLDIIGQAHTGTGKTAAFSLPMLKKVKPKGPIQSLVLVPTRELAIQVTYEINRFGKYTGIRTASIYGGQSIGIQYDQLRRGVQIIVATPGRLIDFIKRDSINLDNVNFVVLDEADRMLDMGFIDDIKFILFSIEIENRQICLFSATMPPTVLRLAREYMKKDVKEIRLNEEELSLDTIRQSYLIIPEKEKFKHLCNFIRNQNKEQTIVFAATKQRTGRLAEELKHVGFKVTTIHGNLSQKERNISMNRFRNGRENVLVATDIAARGIDIPSVSHIINYDVPIEPMMYFHRIGRTARAGATGNAVSLVTPERLENFVKILRNTNQPIHKLNDEMGISVPVISERQHRLHIKTRPFRKVEHYRNSGRSKSSDKYHQNEARGFGKKREKYSDGRYDKRLRRYIRFRTR
ncbi:MAG TPA: DEAD/DEAH box helicase [Nitrososphaeraceae archaeon]|nr:DEAD/DEAH box helicase [Nitrososphaeraceae archaeon]